MLGRPKNRRKPNEARLRLPAINWHALGIGVGALSAVGALALAVLWAFDQPIQTVSVQGRFQRVAPVDVERVVKASLHGTGLLSVDLAAVRRAIHTLPWVDAVSVERAWPRALSVLVIEQTAAARWGEKGLLNTRGELFDSDERHIPPELAQLSGPDGKESLVAQRYLATEGRLMQAGLRLTAMRLVVLEELQQHVHHAQHRTGGLAPRGRQRRERMKGPVDIRRAVDENQVGVARHEA